MSTRTNTNMLGRKPQHVRLVVLFHWLGPYHDARLSAALLVVGKEGAIALSAAVMFFFTASCSRRQHTICLEISYSGLGLGL